jgi:ferredoxin-NADP reductase
LEEGLVGAGDEIVKVASGEEGVTVAEVDALLYLPGHPRDRLERALRIPALSSGWKGSLQALLRQDANRTPGSGNAGLSGLLSSPPAWSGFRVLRVAGINRESAAVVSILLEAPDRSRLPSPLPGQFVVVRLPPRPGTGTALRNYSLSGAPSAGVYRISVKREMNGVASNFLHDQVNVGDVLEVSAPRGSFTLQPGSSPAVLLSAGIGATPVLAMLHALASERSNREVWWLYGARNGREHPFANESLKLLSSLANGRRCIAYSKPEPGDRPGRDFDRAGRLSIAAIEQLAVPREADFYLCGPANFLSTLTAALQAWGVESRRIHSEIFGPGESVTPGITAPRRATGARPDSRGSGPQVTFVRSGVTASWEPQFHTLLELAETCNVPVRWSCRTGVCHTCESGLIGGAIDYEPVPLEPPADGNVLICCSRPRTDVEIDL